MQTCKFSVTTIIVHMKCLPAKALNERKEEFPSNNESVFMSLVL